MKLSEEQRDDILGLLAEDQVRYLKEEMKRGKRTVFANAIAKQKGERVPETATFEDIEQLIDSWVLVGYTDAGHVTPELKCECGRSLRHQYHVINKQTGAEHKFGIDHLELHTGIDAKTVADIRSGFSQIDLELDEILLKIDAGWSIRKEPLPPFEHLTLPADIQRHIDLELPLLERQIARIKTLLNDYARVRRQTYIESLPPVVTNAKPVPQEEPDLFSFLEPEPESEPSPAPGGVFGDGLTEETKRAILGYLRDGVQSSKIIAELLIKHGKTSDSRFITGTPKIVVDVCWYIESFIPSKQCRLISIEQNDRLYEWCG